MISKPHSRYATSNFWVLPKITNRLGILLTATAFFISLLIVYYVDISRFWGYMGFDLKPNLFRLITSIITLTFFSVLVRTKEDTTSFIQNLIFLAYICPSLVLFSIGGASIAFFLASCTGFTVLILASLPRFQRPLIARLSKKSFLVLMLAVTVIAILSIVGFGGWRYFSLDIFRVYEFRSVSASSIPSIFGYIVSPVSKVVLPIGVLLGLYYRNRTSIIVFLFLTVIMFGLTHHKSTLAAPVVTLIIYWSLSRYGVRRSLTFVFAFVSAIIMLEVLHLYLADSGSSGWFSTFIVRRVFLVPPLLDNYYIEFFSEHPLIYWSTSKISFGLVDTDYTTTAPFLIGDFFFGRSEMSANTGFVGSGYSNAGFVGVVIYAVIIGIILAILNSHGRHVGHFIVICASLTVIISAVTSSDLVTVFLTHGLLFLMICLSFMPRQEA